MSMLMRHFAAGAEPTSHTYYRGVMLPRHVDANDPEQVKAAVSPNWKGYPDNYGAHWTTDREQAERFAVGTSPSSHHWWMGGPERPVHGVVIEAHSPHAPQDSTNPFYLRGFESEVDPPRDISSAMLHVHRIEPVEGKHVDDWPNKRIYSIPAESNQHTASAPSYNERGRLSSYRFTGHEPAEGEHAIFRGIFLGHQTPDSPRSTDPDEVLRQIREHGKQRFDPEHPRLNDFGVHWSQNPQTAHSFALDPQHGQYRTPRRGDKYPLLGAVVELHTKEQPSTRFSQYGESELDQAPERKNVTRAWLHVHRFDPSLEASHLAPGTEPNAAWGPDITQHMITPHPVDFSRQNTHVSTTEIPLDSIHSPLRRESMSMSQHGQDQMAFPSHDDKHKVYVRFGDWPEDERSTNFVMGWKEDGVSAYDIGKDGDPIDPDGAMTRAEHHEGCEPDCTYHNDEDFGNDTYGEMKDRQHKAEQVFRNGVWDAKNARGHLVTGDHVGFGHDDEPLLRNVRRVGDWVAHRHLFVPTAEPHPLLKHHTPEDDAERKEYAERDFGEDLVHPHVTARKTASDRDYQGGHTAPGPDDAPLHDLTPINGEEIYSHPHYFMHGAVGDSYRASEQQSHSVAARVRNRPDAKVTVYRAVPHHVHDINSGDWVSLTPAYARQHAVRTDDPKDDWKVLKASVPAKHVNWDGNSLNEWGYNGPDLPDAAVHAKGGKRAQEEYQRSQKAKEQGRSDYWPKQVEEGLTLHQTHAVELPQHIHDLVHDPNASRFDKVKAVSEHLRANKPYFLGHPTWHDDIKESVKNPVGGGTVGPQHTLVTYRHIPKSADEIHGGDGSEVWLHSGTEMQHRRLDLHDHKGRSLGGGEIDDPLPNRLGSKDVDDIMGLLGKPLAPRPQPTAEESAQQEQERQERIKAHQDWQNSRPGLNPGEDISTHQMGKDYPHAEWVPIGLAQHFREHTADDNAYSQGKVDDLTEQFRAGRGITDPLMLLHHNEENRASLGEGNHRLRAMERAGWSHVPMRVVRMYDGEAAEGKGRPIPQDWRGSLQGRTPEMARPSEVFSSGALDSGDVSKDSGSKKEVRHEEARGLGGHPRGGSRLGEPGRPRRDARPLPRSLARLRRALAGDDAGAQPLRPVTWHPKAKKEYGKFDKPSQKAIDTTLEGLQRGDSNLQTHALTGPLKGWYSTKASRGHRIVHQNTPDGGIHIGAVSLHDYTEAINRLGAHRSVTEKDGTHYDGIMIAFVPPKEIADALAIEDGTESPENLHITLAYLGDTDEYSPEQVQDLYEIVTAWAEGQEPLQASTQGAGTFLKAEEGGQHVLWASVNVPGINALQADLVDYLKAHGYHPRENHGFTPHITLTYAKHHVRFLPKVERMTFTCDEVWVCVGGEWESAPLGRDLVH